MKCFHHHHHHHHQIINHHHHHHHQSFIAQNKNKTIPTLSITANGTSQKPTAYARASPSTELKA